MQPPENLTELLFVPDEHREAARRAVLVAYQLGRIDGTMGPALNSVRKFAHQHQNFDHLTVLGFVLDDCPGSTVSLIQSTLAYMQQAGEIFSDGRGSYILLRYPPFAMVATP